MPMKMPNFIQKILSQIDVRNRLLSNFTSKCHWRKMLSEENNNFISKYMVFFIWQNSFILPHKGE
jgi:hypothetical protein